ncbi:RNA methyltransferase [Tepidibacillus marianensis]|uniref:TrmH family RNA methyltransferase n=1 Tax=Tepidibacillus marianensis TaxID=3131995 RepID=UPI0030D13CF8
MEIIQSLKNPKVKSWVSLKMKQGRMEQGVYLIEGFKLVEEAIRSKVDIQSIIYGMEHEIPFSWQPWIQQSDISLYQVSQSIIEKLTDTKTPQGFYAIIEQKKNSLEDLINKRFLLLVDEVQDPGNLGTIIRSADAAGIEAIVLGKGTVDVYNGKVIRSAMGSMFHVPFVEADLTQVILKLQDKGFIVVGTSPHTEKNYFELDYKQRMAIIVGNESKGLSEIRIEQVDQMVKIPFMGMAESLNVAIATAIILFERVRQLSE